MKRTNHVLIMALVAVFAFSTVAMAQTKWAYQSNYSEGMACVKNDQGKYGYIDKTGKVVIPFQFEEAYSFEKSVAKVQDENRVWRKIDKTGKYIE